MDESGVDVQVLSMTTPALHNLEPEESLILARRTNDLVAATIANYPTRFQGFATLPTAAPEDAALELERSVQHLGLAGAMLCGRTRDKNLDHPDFKPMFETAAKLGVPLFVHPQIPQRAVRDVYPEETRDSCRASDLESEYDWNSVGQHRRCAMRAVVLHEYGGPEKLKFEENVPEPQMSGSTVLIAAAAASVNPIDWKLRSGMMQKNFPLTFPAILGRDVSGIVRAVGANVKHFKAGDRVLALSNKTYGELVAVDDSDVTHLPDGVDLADAAAIPLISLTGDQLVRLATNVKKGQVVLITGALGSVGRAAVHTAKKIGAQVIAGVRGKELDDARFLGVSDVLAIDDDQAIKNFPLADAIADTVGGDVAAKLIARVKQNGSFGYTAVLPEGAAAQNPTVKITRVGARPDASKVREFADDVRDGKFVLPIGRRMPLRDAAEAHVLGEKGGIGKILLLAPDSQD
jgi:NADPH:quinone reductase-like Zn-dependent oxidoreductase